MPESWRSAPEPVELALVYLDSDTERCRSTTTAWEAHKTKPLGLSGWFVSSRNVFGADERRNMDQNSLRDYPRWKTAEAHRQNNPFQNRRISAFSTANQRGTLETQRNVARGSKCIDQITSLHSWHEYGISTNKIWSQFSSVSFLVQPYRHPPTMRETKLIILLLGNF